MKKKRVSNTDFNIQFDLKSELEKEKKKMINKEVASKSYDSELPKKAVGRLFEEYEKGDEIEDDDEIDDDDQFTSANIAVTLDDENEDEDDDEDEEYKNYVKKTSKSINKSMSKGLVSPSTIEGVPSNKTSRKSTNQNKNKLNKYTNIDTDIDDDDEFESDYGNSNISNLFKPSYIIACISIVFLLILSYFIVNINSASATIKKLQAEITQSKEKVDNYNKLDIENESLKTQLDNLEKEAEQLKSTQVAEVETTIAATEEVVETEELGPKPNAGANTPFVINGKYTVVSGDNLSKIAKKVYGDASRAKDIQSANSITEPDKIQIGDILLIP